MEDKDRRDEDVVEPGSLIGAVSQFPLLKPNDEPSDEEIDERRRENDEESRQAPNLIPETGLGAGGTEPPD